MGLRDAFKSLRRDNDGEPEEMAIESEATDSTWFQPRFDGFYQGEPADGSDGPERYLRFYNGSKVAEAVDLDGSQVWRVLTDPAADTSNGDYTGVGSFCVQRQFERPTVYTVLEVDEEGFTARCTATSTGTTKPYLFNFVASS